MSKKLRLMFERDTREVAHPRGNPDKAPVDQTFNEDSKIHTMLDKFARGEIHPRQPFFADVSDFSDFQSLKIKTMHLEREFQKLPAQVRALAGNNPANLGSVLKDPKNTDFLREYGVFEQLQKNSEASPPTEEPSVPIKAPKAPTSKE